MVTADKEIQPQGTPMWAQVGYGRLSFASPDEPTAPYRTFAQYTRACRGESGCPTHGLKTVFAPAPSETKTYTNVLKKSTQRIHMRANGVQILKTAYDPAKVWRPEWAAQFFGETKDWQSDVPGTVVDPVNFSRIQRYESNGTSTLSRNSPEALLATATTSNGTALTVGVWASEYIRHH